MNKLKALLCVFIPFAAAFTAARLVGAEAPNSKQPVLILLYSRFEDYSQMYPAADRVIRLLSQVERFRKQYPRQPITPVFQFSGAMSNAIHSLSEQHEIKKLLREGAAKGLFEYGYAGDLEPTPRNRPLPETLTAESVEERWTARYEAAHRFLTEYKDPVTGAPVVGLTGGVQAEQQIFGPPAILSGLSLKLGSDTAFVHELKRMKIDGVLWGLPDPNPARGIHGYGGSVTGFSKAMSPIAETSPEVYWEENYLRSSDFGQTDLRVFSTTEELAKLKEAFGKIDRSHVRVVHMEYGSYLRYLRLNADGQPRFHPLFWLWDHPQEPVMPNAIPAMLGMNEITPKYQAEEATMKWLLEEFLPANPGSRFVSATELKRMAVTPLNTEVSKKELAGAVDDLLASYERIGASPPNWVRSGDSFFSLADMFSLLVQSLAKQNPETVRLTELYGPLFFLEGNGPVNGEVSAGAVRRAAAELAPKLVDTAWKLVPSNVTPVEITVDGLKLNAAQFLGLMAQAWRSKSPDEKLRVQPRYMHSPAAEVYPHHIAREDMGNMWTCRPVRLRL